MNKLLFFSLMCSVFSFNLFAKEEILSITDNDDNNEVYHLVVNIDDNTQRLDQLYKDTYIGEEKIRRDVLNSENLKTKEGMILEKRDKYNILNLKSNNLDYDRGGRIIIDTLYNAITGERRLIELDLAKDKDSWRLFKNQKAVSRFHVKVNKVIVIGSVGIKSILIE